MIDTPDVRQKRITWTIAHAVHAMNFPKRHGTLEFIFKETVPPLISLKLR